MEKSLFAQTAEIDGLAAEKDLYLCFQFTPETDKDRRQRGTLFLIAKFEKPINMEIKQSFIEGFRQEFYTQEGSNLLALEKALNISQKNFLIRGLVEIAATVLWGNVLYVAKSGDSLFFLVRQGKLKRIDFYKTASGSLRSGDLVIFGSRSLLDSIDERKVLENAEKKDFDEAAKIIENELKDKPGKCLLLKFSIQEQASQLEFLQPIDLNEEISGRSLIDLIDSLRDKSSAFFRRVPRPKLPADLTEKSTAVAKKGLRFFFAKGKKIASFVAAPWRPRSPGEIENKTWRRNQRIIQVVVVLSLILFLSLTLATLNRFKKEAEKKLNQKIESVQQKISSAEAMKDLDREQAMISISEANEEIKSLPAKNERVKKLQSKLNLLLVEINRVFKVKAEFYSELGLLKGGIEAGNLQLSGRNGFFLDKASGSVYVFSLNSKEPTIFVSEEKDLQAYQATNNFLYLIKKAAIERKDINSKTQTTAYQSAKNLENILATSSYRDNLYILDKNFEIWRYLATSSGLATPQAYLREKLSFTPTGLAIDGSVWISSKNNIFKYFAGEREDFSLKGLPASLSAVSDIYTSEKETFLFVLDKGSGRIVVINKADGQYKEAYEEPLLKEADSFFASSVEKKIFFLANNAIFTINLK